MLSTARSGIDAALHKVLRPTTMPALVAFLVIVAAGIYAEHQNRQVYQRDLHAQVFGAASLVRARLEGSINGSIQLMRGLAATLELDPQMTQAEFSARAARILDGNTLIRSIAVAPDMVVRLVHPLRGNERVIGFDLRNSMAQRDAGMRVRDTGRIVLAGPVDLVQGGRGLIARVPLHVEDEFGLQHFWGILSAIIDLDRLYVASGLLDADLPIDIAITGHDGLGGEGNRFFGSEDVLRSSPVSLTVGLPSGSWQIAAIPAGAGWASTPPNEWILRLIMFVAGALILVPIFFSGKLIEERQRNIADLRERERELLRLSRRLGLALDSSRIGVWELDVGTNRLLWDDRMNELYGYPAGDGPRSFSDWESRVHPDDLPKILEGSERSIAAGASFHTQYRLLLPGGEVRHIRESAKVYQDPGEPLRIVGVNWDVTADVALNQSLTTAMQLTEARNLELVAAKGRIEHNALHDSLTGLPNRRYLDELLLSHVERFAAGAETAGLLHMDLDRFKQINDTLGHAAGDAMLVHTAQVLRECVSHHDFVARVGGDEFVIVCLRRADDPEARLDHLAGLAERIIERMQQPVQFDGHDCRFGASIGIAFDAPGAADPKQLLVHADIALYRAKSRGRNRYQFFNDALEAEIVSTKRIADEILSGIEQKQFVAHYQPQFDARTLDIVGVEALARWNHPREGVILPASFMRIAEELNVVDTIDRMILEQTLQDLDLWAERGIVIPKASVNVSARRLRNEELVETLRQMAIQPGRIAFELVESIFLDEQDELVAWNVDHIKELGIDIEIDDFGTGYASIVSLLKLKPSRLKIDRQLVMPIVRSPAQRQLVGSIIDIGKSLGIEVLAEGVETMEHASILAELGCDALQGYAFTRPMTPDELVDFVAARRWRRAS